MKIQYPFTPKSNHFLREGQFWAIPLSDGKFACGRVLAQHAFGQTNRKGVHIGLMDWVGKQPPTSEDLTGVAVIADAESYVGSISNTGGQVLGIRALEVDNLKPFKVSYTVDSSVQVWGWKTIKNIAESYFVQRKSLNKDAV